MTAGLFDSHLHLTASRFGEDRDEVIARARAVGVAEMTTIASNPRDAREAIVLAEADAAIWATAGLHPHEAADTSDAVLADIEALAASPRVVALGETGLDYHYDNAPRDRQIENFRGHLELGGRLDLPVVVHSRSAEADTCALIRELGGHANGVLHCFSGGDDLLATVLRADWYISFSGLVTFVDALADAVRAAPADRILIETDAPYLAPVPKRGRRNEPSFLPHTCAAVAALRSIPVEEAGRITRDNARRFYGVDS